jgi:hypothetical protein
MKGGDIMKNIKAHKLYIANGIYEAKRRFFGIVDEDSSEARMLKNRIIIWTEHLNDIKDLKES